LSLLRRDHSRFYRVSVADFGRTASSGEELAAAEEWFR
jgi:hypothetical protein